MEGYTKEEIEVLYLELNKKYNKLKKKYYVLAKKYKQLSFEDLKIGQKLKYLPTDEQVTLLKVHYDDTIPYYTIKMPDNREKQTTKDRLIKN